MKRDFVWWLRIAVAAVVVAGLTIGLIGSGAFNGSNGTDDGRTSTVRIGASGISLVAFDNCESALRELRNAALPLVTPYGLTNGYGVAEDSGVAGGAQAPVPGAPRAAAPPGAAEERKAAPSEGGAAQQAPGHSTTNTHEAGVDEPDLVKTDGRRLITIADGKLRVVDVASRKITATIELPGAPATQLLVSGDRALVMTANNQRMVPQQRGGPPIVDLPPGYESQLVLVDLNAAKVLGTLSVEGSYLDARQIGSVARVVVRSGPHLGFVYPDGIRSENESLFRNQEIVRNAPVSDWVPRYELSVGDKRDSGQLVECAAMSRPETFTGTAMLTVLTFDLTKDLGKGDPVSIVADGDTVYGTETSLYVADDHYPHVGGFVPPRRFAPPQAQRTEVYQFDISKPGKPIYVASGGVDGMLLNQYSLSEWAGHLRIATTVTGPGQCCDQPGRTESMVTVLARKSDALQPVGKVGGLGVGERIYAVRFFGPTGYVVTFRQTDPLYTVDLSNPAAPRVVGELKINGYSAYLHPAGDGKLIGVGQEATDQGRRLGTQVSLFDTGNPASVRRLAQHQLPGGMSEVEFDPHAFLYWPEKGLVVVPIMPTWRGDTQKPMSGALVLRLNGDSFTEVGMVSHPADLTRYPDASVRRAMVIGSELWTVSWAGVLVNDVDKLSQLAWIPFS